MNKRELIAALAGAAGLSKKDAAAVIEALFGTDGIIVSALRAREPVQLTGFGTFDATWRKARMGRNPRSGQSIEIRPTMIPRFRVGRDLRDAVLAGVGPVETTASAPPAAWPAEAVPSEPFEGESEESAGPTDDDATDDEIPVILSAGAPEELAIGGADEVQVRIECDDAAAAPLPAAARGRVSSRVDITIVVSISGSAVELVDPWVRTVPPPKVGTPTTTSFEIRAVEVGTSTIDLKFLQGAQPVAALALHIEAVAERSSDDRVSARGRGHPREPKAYEHAMYVHVEEREHGEGANRQVSYSYLLTAERLELGSAQWERAIDGTIGPFVKRLHRDLVERIRAQRPEDDDHFGEEIMAKARSMGRLFPDDMVRTLWDLRDDIGNILLNSKEKRPLPWELLCMVHPDKRGRAAWDDRHLAEYGVSRQISRHVGPKRLRGEDWGYMFAEYPRGTYPPTDFGRDYFEQELKDVPGVTVRSLPATPLGLVTDLEAGDLDVIHLGCHGESDLEDAGTTSLIVGDRRVRRDTPQGPQFSVEPVRLTPEYVRDRIDLSDRSPIVFLNACESGRRPPGIHGLEGWPDIFLNAGAGAFIGTSWSVKGEAAEAFAVTFYRSLRDGETLSDATRAARKAAQDAKRDASWLAYSVYGYPTARLVAPGEEV
jgi:nucleoid DNA-binding protein